MRVTVVRTGGFAGISLRADVDTADLPTGPAGTVERLVGAALDCAPGDDDAAVRPTPDRFDYEVQVDARTWTLGESSLPGPWRELVDEVMTLGRTPRPPAAPTSPEPPPGP